MIWSFVLQTNLSKNIRHVYKYISGFSSQTRFILKFRKQINTQKTEKFTENKTNSSEILTSSS